MRTLERVTETRPAADDLQSAREWPDPGPELAREDAGYRKALRPRQIQMIAIGGAIGTGLFLGAGGRLHDYGPALMFVYALCAIFAFLILRALGELVLHRPSSGSFVSYAREFFGERFAYTAGWLYFLNWAMTSIVDTTAASLYVRFWARYVPFLQEVPTWLTALVALLVVLTLNLLSVRLFGEMEFWFALVKVTALIAFLVIGVVFLVFVHHTDIGGTGLQVVAEHGGLFPVGFAAPLISVGGIVFAYAGIELVGTAAGETKEPAKVIPRAVNTVIVRIAVFYVGSVLLLALLLPYSSYSGQSSPFVTFFRHAWGADTGAVAASIMNFVVLTAALSSLNVGLYSTGRILKSMSANGSAPRFVGVMNKSGVPYGGILLTASITVLGVVLNAVLGATKAFEVVLEVSSLGIVGMWATIVLCQMRYRRWVKEGKADPPSFRMPGAPVTAWVTLGFLLFVLVTLGFSETGRWVLASLVVLLPLLVIGWFAQRKRIMEAALLREGYTGASPVLAKRIGRAD